MESRVQVQQVTPNLDGGRYAAKAVVGDDVIVGADVFREGHDTCAAVIAYRSPGERDWRESPLLLDVNDRWYGAFPVDRVGAWHFQIVAWTDHWASWLSGVTKKHVAGRVDPDLDPEEGARLLERRTVDAGDQPTVQHAVTVLRAAEASLDDKLAAAGARTLLEALARNPERLDATRSPELPLWVDREAARFSAWYEFFPRSEGAVVDTEPPRSGTLCQAAQRLAAVAEMGFDVVYLPPIHPIGRTWRKGPNNTLSPGPGDPGVPWAIGGAEGGHTSVHPDLGTIADFDAFVSAARAHHLEVAMDYAIQCSPDHPWVTAHPQWFKHRPDGTVQFAENPPKQYQDIYPLDFDTPDIAGLQAELKRVLDFWIGHGVRIFRVDNPHTKALPFWEWVIDAVHREHPDVLFLAEAFTRPKMMQTLAKLGFSQSYTYFTWRNTKTELTEYLTELTRTEMVEYYRPSFWPNTPDILTEFLQTGGPAAFRLRLLLAALLSPAYGIYSGYELCEHLAVREGSEEYLDSEKYQYRPRDWSRPDSLAPWIARINRIRRSQPALRLHRTLRFHAISDAAMLCFSKVDTERGHPVLVVANLDPHTPREAVTGLDLWQLGLEHAGPYEATDLLTDTTHIWHGSANYVRLDPAVEPAHVLALRAL